MNDYSNENTDDATNQNKQHQLQQTPVSFNEGMASPNTFTQVIHDDGRNFFRLSNIVGVAVYFPLSLEQDDDFADGYDSRLQVPPILALLNQSREAQVDNNMLLKQIRNKNNNVGRYLERLNDRLDLLQKAILYIDKSFPKLSWQWLHYSEAGIDFLIPHQQSQHISPLQSPARTLVVGDRLHLILGIPDSSLSVENTKAILPRNHYVYQPHFSAAGYISVVARITSLDDETAALRVGCAFEAITDFDRQFLARHILSVQSFRRRQSLDQDV